jgi:hypothetical protein
VAEFEELKLGRFVRRSHVDAVSEDSARRLADWRRAEPFSAGATRCPCCGQSVTRIEQVMQSL